MHCDEIQVKVGKLKIGVTSTATIYQVKRLSKGMLLYTLLVDRLEWLRLQ